MNLLQDEVYGFDESEEGEEENDVEQFEENEEGDDGIDMGSDIEDEERVRDERAWGKKKQYFYGTNHVDQDYEGAYEGREVLEAEFEEEEARKIQKRLIEQLDDADFSLADIIDTTEAPTEPSAKDDVIKTDLSQLTKRQKLDLLQKESPEFFVLIEDFKNKLTEVQKRLIPVLNLVSEKKIQQTPAVDFVETKFQIVLNYCTNICFYLLLKAKRIPVKNHPVLKSLFRYRQLLKQIEEVDTQVINPQIDALLEKFYSGKKVNLKKASKYVNCFKVFFLFFLAVFIIFYFFRSAKKKMLKLLEKPKPEKKLVRFEDEKMEEEPDEELEEPQESESKDGLGHIEGKRSITWEIAKNKGLTPRRPKEQRNPRVKYRNKFRKAKIRRKGQVRLPRSEIPVYGGELTGIKVGVTKSIKLK